MTSFSLQINGQAYTVEAEARMPHVEIHIVESDQPPTGMGERGVPPIAPAVANAVLAVTGKRIWHIPIRPEDLRA